MADSEPRVGNAGHVHDREALLLVARPSDAGAEAYCRNHLSTPPAADSAPLVVLTDRSGVEDHRRWDFDGRPGVVVAIVVGVEALVQAALSLEAALGVPSAVWGLTVVAAGTSLPDTVVSVRAAEAGRGPTSLANVLGSNTFDLLVAVPVGVLLVPGGTVALDFGTAVPMMGFLTVATLGFLVVTRTDLELDRPEAISLLGLYGVFIAWMVLETLGVTALVPGI